jgi:hypothetical protein
MNQHHVDAATRHVHDTSSRHAGNLSHTDKPSYMPSHPKTAYPQCFSAASAPAGWATVTQGSDSSDENGEVVHG